MPFSLIDRNYSASFFGGRKYPITGWEQRSSSRFEAFGRDVGVAPTKHFHSNQLMLNSYD